MENFVVSARKYRPVTFDTVIGQKAITDTLKNAIRNNHLAQAFLFCGPRGVGKTTCARILAKIINCENPGPNFESCNVCVSCKSFEESNSFNVHELDAASNNSVEDIRNLVEKVRIPPQIGKYKVYIIDEVHMLSSQAFNAFLKTLEEPPPFVKFILATTEKHKIIPTILSRCQIFDFSLITVDDIAKHLAFVAQSENIKSDIESLHAIALKSDGALRDALSIFDQLVSFAGNSLTYKQVIENLNILDYEYYFKMTENILASDTSSILLMVNEIIENGFDGLHFLLGLGEHFRNLLISKDASTLKLLEVSSTIIQRYQEQSASCEANFLLKNLEIISKTDYTYRTSSNKRLLVELALLQMCHDFSVQTTSIQKKTLDKSIQPILSEKIPVSAKNEVQTPLTDVKVSVPNVAIEKKDTPKTKILFKRESVSIKDYPTAENTVENPELLSENLVSVKSEPFTQESLEKNWKIYINKISDSNPSFASTLMYGNPIIIENNHIEVNIETKIQAEELNIKKGDLLEFLRNKLKNDLIQLSVKTTITKSSLSPYTAKEKFKKMAEENMAINKLKQNLNLELEL